MGTQKADRVANCNMNTDNGQGLVEKQLYTYPRQETDRPNECYTNTGNSKSNNVDKPTVHNNEINYFLPDPNQKNDKKASDKITQKLQRDFKDVFNGIGALMEPFHYRSSKIANHTRYP